MVRVDAGGPSGLDALGMREFVGIAVSPGYGSGPAFVYRGTQDLFAAATVAGGEGRVVEARRFHEALEATRREMQALQRRMQEDYGTHEAHILHAQFLMLDDPLLVEGVAGGIERDEVSAEAAVVATVRRIEDQFGEMSDQYLRERAVDVYDVGARLLRHLADPRHHPLVRLAQGQVIVAERLLPSDTIFLDQARISAMVTERGSENSHVAVLARSLGIPAVTQAHGILAACATGEPLAVDGVVGRVILRPEGLAGDEYTRRARHYEASVLVVRDRADGEPVTRDGVTVELMANMGLMSEVELVAGEHVQGVGLLRTEFLLLSQAGPTSEDEQYAIYRRIAEACGERPVNVRTLDLGPDKIMPLANDVPLAHAALTERGVHYSLRHPELFLPQLRAILRAARFGNLRIMLPMVTGIAEIRAVRELLEELCEGLGRIGEGPESVPAIGVMIETPPAVIMASEIAREVDFLSIGSNDLLRYLFAGEWLVDRPDEQTALEPCLLRAIDHTVRAADAAGVEVALCGEMAGTPSLTALLVGLGLRVLSMNLQRLVEVRYNIRELEAARAAELAGEALRLPTASDVMALLAAHVDPWHKLLEREEGRTK